MIRREIPSYTFFLTLVVRVLVVAVEVVVIPDATFAVPTLACPTTLVSAVGGSTPPLLRLWLR